MAMIPAWRSWRGHNEDSYFLRCCTACFYILVIALSGYRFCEGHPGISGLICIFVLEVIISRGYWCLCLFMCTCSCLAGWHSRTSGCTPLPWRITGSGRSRASAWQRSRGLRIENYSRNRRCVNVSMCASEYVCVCARILRGDGWSL